ncbi:MAG: TVP38/TMEM64 family protein, partial [Geminicoccaceae bacterium]
MNEATDIENEIGDGGQRSLLKRLLPVALIVVGIGAFFAFGLDDYLTFDALREHRGLLLAFVADHPLTAPLAFI